MSKTTGVGALLTGMAIGAAALFLSEEKNRAKVKASILQLTGDAKEWGAKLKDSSSEAMDDVKKQASLAAQSVQKSSKEAAISALKQTEKAAKSARTNLSSSNTTAKK